MNWLKIMIFSLLALSFSNFCFAQGVSAEATGLEKEITEQAPLIEISRLEAKEPLYSIELRSANLNDFFRLLAHDYDLNILVDERVDGLITASFTNISLDAALENIAQLHGLILEKNKGVTTVKPNLVTKTIVFQYIDAASFLIGGAAVTSLGLQADIGTAGSSYYGTTGSSYSTGTTGSSYTSTSTTASTSGTTKGLSSVYDLLSDIGQILLGQQRNLIMVIDYPENVKKIEDFAQAVDGSMGRRIFKLKYLNSKQLAIGIEEEEKKFALGEPSESTSRSGSTSSSGSSY